MKKIKIGLFGGSFNPIHLGHLEAANIINKKLKLDKLFFIPNFISPHKINNHIASVKDRLEMINLAIKEFNNFKISEYEVNNKNISYSIDTINYYRLLYPTAELYFLTGSDIIRKLESWYKINEIFEKCTFVIFTRPEFESINDLIRVSALRNDHKISLLKNKINLKTNNISSSNVRLNVYDGKNIKKFVPYDVYKYIIDKNMYKNNI